MDAKKLEPFQSRTGNRGKDILSTIKAFDIYSIQILNWQETSLRI